MIPPTLKHGTLTLEGLNSNAYAILAAVQRSLRKAGNTKHDIEAVLQEMKSGDYDHLLVVAMQVTKPEEDMFGDGGEGCDED